MRIETETLGARNKNIDIIDSFCKYKILWYCTVQKKVQMNIARKLSIFLRAAVGAR